MISIVIPVTDRHELTRRAINKIYRHCSANHDDVSLWPDVIVIDNGSVEPYKRYREELVIRNEKNIGVFPAVLQGLAVAHKGIVLVMHNDVLIHEDNFDARILNEFRKDPLLGIAGFFGGRGVAENGGRDIPESNMQGLEWGQHGSLHGHVQTETHPAVVFDSLAMIYNRDIFYTVFPEQERSKIAPHHWFDRIVTLGIVMAGYHALTIGIAFDHYGGGTSVANTAFDDFTRQWVEDMGIPVDKNPDYTMYRYGEQHFRDMARGLFPVRVDKNFNVTYNGRRKELINAVRKGDISDL